MPASMLFWGSIWLPNFSGGRLLPPALDGQRMQSKAADMQSPTIHRAIGSFC
jgi:hypothetical protein